MMETVTELQLKVEKRWWFSAAFEALTISCALVSFFSVRAALRLSDAGTTVLARKGLRLNIVPVD